MVENFLYLLIIKVNLYDEWIFGYSNLWIIKVDLYDEMEKVHLFLPVNWED